MKRCITAKSINGNVISGFAGLFIWDMFDPDTVIIDFGGNVWSIDREMLMKGGDFGGDVAIAVDEYDTIIGLIDSKSGKVTPIVFDTPAIQDFLYDSTLGVDIPHMREVEVDNCIVEFYNWNTGLVA